MHTSPNQLVLQGLATALGTPPTSKEKQPQQSLFSSNAFWVSLSLSPINISPSIYSTLGQSNIISVTPASMCGMCRTRKACFIIHLRNSLYCIVCYFSPTCAASSSPERQKETCKTCKYIAVSQHKLPVHQPTPLYNARSATQQHKLGGKTGIVYAVVDSSMTAPLTVPSHLIALLVSLPYTFS